MIFSYSQIILIMEMMIFKVLKGNFEKSFLILSFFQLSFLLGMRKINVGIDTPTYAKLFSYMAEGHQGYLEIGNYYLTRLISLTGDGYQPMLIAYACLTVGMTLYAIYHLSEDIYLSTLLYSGLLYYSFAFNGMRQALACAIIMISYVYLKNNHIKCTAMLIGIAGLFHFSAYVTYIIIPFTLGTFKIRKNNRNQIIYISLLLIFMLLIGIYGFRLLEEAQAFLPRYAAYIDRHARGLGYQHKNSSWNILFYLLIYFFSYFQIARKKLEWNFDRLSLVMLSIGVTIYFIAMNFALVARLSLYFTISIIWLLPNTIKYMNGYAEKKIFQCVFVLLSLVYECALIYVEANGMVPYYFYWE